VAAKINLSDWYILAVNGATNRRFMITTSLLAIVIQFAKNPYEIC